MSGRSPSTPRLRLPTEGSLGAYVVVGGGFYHKVTNFTRRHRPPGLRPLLWPIRNHSANRAARSDHYISNAVGVNGGFGLTYKFSKFSNQRFYMEARYVYVANEQRPGDDSR